MRFFKVHIKSKTVHCVGLPPLIFCLNLGEIPKIDELSHKKWFNPSFIMFFSQADF